MSESIETPASKAAARQAKLLAKSKERLAKITGAAKGEGRIASDTPVGIASSSKPTVTASNPAPPKSLSIDDDPEDIDLALQIPTTPSRNTRSKSNQSNSIQQAQLEAMGLGGMSGMGGGPESLFPGMMGNGSAGAGGDIFSQMMASMNAGAGGGLGGTESMTTGFIPLGSTTPTPKSTIDRLFPLVHFLSMIGIAIYSIFFLEPSRKFGLYGWMEGINQSVNWNDWAALSGKNPARNVVTKIVGTGLADVPLFWMFITVEMLLQTTRLFIVRNRPPPPGFLGSVLPILSQFSPQLAFILTTIMKYFHLLSICLNDLAVLIFCVGLAVIYGQFKVGTQSGVIRILEDVGEKVVDLIKDEL